MVGDSCLFVSNAWIANFSAFLFKEPFKCWWMVEELIELRKTVATDRGIEPYGVEQYDVKIRISTDWIITTIDKFMLQ